MNFFKTFCVVLFIFNFLNADVIQNQNIKTAINILNDFANSKQNSLKKGDIKAIAIVPSVSKIGLLASVSKSEGIFIAKNDNGEWSNPFFINYTSGGFGPQIGITSSDLIIFFKSSRSYDKLFTDNEDTISLNFEVAAMDKGIRDGISTDFPELSAYMLIKGNSSGWFIGSSLDVARMSINRQNLNDYYERMYTYEDILNNSPKESKYTLKLKEIASKFF
ncbi:hypothetical membrane protein (DUF500 domain) [Campylobacter pinnipediorum subsp. pinnipediorum]|uniref:lipid-binding SYLF domain-containing protein n=1 Tax=Campylobacter pinnipediorum TaxID=1965231 RepID=UPI000995849F|nr:lipid-binding SYLF domain-containing protein [Campylobacter pinnipediorum]AQW81726.1 hypothetical membrane protein (DUF500 domain) [Campylobacter pinnipediorum subsp. pinnipediorum]